MTHQNLDRAQLAAVIYAISNVAVSGTALLTILVTSVFPDSALVWTPNVVAIRVVALAPLSWFVAPAVKSHVTHLLRH